MGYDAMQAWQKHSFEFNDGIRRRGDPYEGRIAWDSEAGRSITQHKYSPPSFYATTSRWSPPSTPTSPKTTFAIPLSPQGSPSISSDHDRPPLPRADSALSGGNVSSLDEKSMAKKLYAASAAGDLQHMKLLISLGAPVNSPTVVPALYEAFKPAKPGYLTPLAGAASYGHHDAAEYLISQGAEVSPPISQSTSSPLQQACRANDLRMVRFLVDYGADIDQQNYYKSTPLMYAVKYGSPELVSFILSRRPDLNAVSFMGSRATHWSVWPGRLEILDLLLQAGASTEDCLADGKTLLHCAALSGWAEGIKLLVNCGADPFKRDSEWRTPLDTAVLNKHESAAEVLKAAMLLAS